MRKRILCLLLAALLLSGCGRGEDPYRVDTVIRIPANPTEEPATEIQTDPPGTAATVAPSESSEETSEETIAEESTAAPTEPEETKASSTGTKNNGKKSNKSNKSNKTDKATEPEETKPKATEPKGTEPAPTQPPATQPPATEPAETQPPETVPPETEIPATEPPATEPEGFDISDYVPDNLQYEMLEKLNEARTEAGLGELPLDEALSAICAVRAWEVCQVWSHTRPDGRDYATILSDHGYSAASAGELLVYVTGSGDASSIVGKWMESDSHRGMILGEGYDTFGIGVYRANGYTFVCCMVVG